MPQEMRVSMLYFAAFIYSWTSAIRWVELKFDWKALTFELIGAFLAIEELLSFNGDMIGSF